MNVIRNLSLRYKLAIIFIFLSLLSVAAFYLFRLFLVVQLFGAATPILEFGEVALLNNRVQKEALRYVTTGEEETVEEFREGVDQLNTLLSQLTLRDDESSEILVAGKSTVLSLIETGEGIIQSHGQTLELLETLKELKDEKEAALAAINWEALLDHADVILTLNQTIVLSERLHGETVEFVLVSEDESLEDIEVSRTTLLVTMEALQADFAETDLAQLANVQPALVAMVEIEGLSAQIIANHIETAKLLQEFEGLEKQVEDTRTALNALAEKDVVSLFEVTDQIVFGGGAAFLVFYLGIALLIARIFIRPAVQLSEVSQKLGQGDYSIRLPVSSKDELGQLTQSFNTMAEHMGGTVADLQQHTRALATSSEVSQRLSTILDPAELTTAVVELLQVTFNYYHAHIYLFDESRKNLVMAGGTGEAGRIMLENKHQIEAGKGLVGGTAVKNKPTLVPDVDVDPNWLPNPLLPETKAEVAVPITLENEVLGVLDIQHNVAGGLDEADVTLLLSIASQVAVGLQNARLFNQVQLEKGQLQTVMESLSTPIVISRVSTGLVTYVNHALTEAFQLPREELVGQITPDFYANPDDRARFLAGLREHGEVKEFEMLLKRGDGNLFWGLASGRIINYEGELAIVASIIDIQARKEAESLLARQANELSTVAKVSTAAATILDPQELLQQVADLTKSSFNLYHAHIHLLDENSQMLVLTAGAGEVGRKMVAEGRRIPLSAAGSLVASVARSVAGAIRNYVSPEEGFMPHPLLAATRSEMAVPIAIGSQVLGVLDVRSDQLNYFDESDLQTVTTLASQVAVALQNARSYTRSEEAFQELQELSRRLTREGWNEFFRQQGDTLAFRFDLNKVSPVAALAEEAEPEPETGLVQPLQVQGEPIGELVLGQTEIKEEEAAEIIAAVAERLSAHIENLRLTEQTQNALANTEALFAGSGSVVRAGSLPEILGALVQATSVHQLDRASLILFERSWDQTPETMMIAAQWEKEASTATLPAGTVLPVSQFPGLHQVMTSDYFYTKDVESDARLDKNVVRIYQEMGIKTAFMIPLKVGEQIIGFISATSPQSVPFDDGAVRRITSLVGQAAVVVQSLRLFEEAQDRARREQMLREMTTRIHAAVDAETILRTAAEEIGRTLGLEGYVSLEAAGSKGVNGHESIAKSRS